MKKPTVEEVATRYYKRVQYHKRIESLIRRCKCSRAEDSDEDEYGNTTYPGAPSCGHMFKADMEEERYDSDSPFCDPPRERTGLEKVWQDWLDDHREARESTWCVRCDRRRTLKVARRKALAAEAATKRALMSAVERSINGADSPV